MKSLTVASVLAALAIAGAVIADAKTCPDVTPAAKKYSLEVTEYDLTLPDGKKVPQLAYNGTKVGPVLEFQAGDEVSIDIKNSLANARR